MGQRGEDLGPRMLLGLGVGVEGCRIEDRRLKVSNLEGRKIRMDEDFRDRLKRVNDLYLPFPINYSLHTRN